MQFKARSYEKEFLDDNDISTPDLYRTLHELNIVNTLLGGYNSTLQGLKKILKVKPIQTVLDVGFGGGDSIKQMAKFSLKRKISLFFYGVDLKKDCINYAEENLIGTSNKELICDDYRNISPKLLEKIDVIHSCLFLHHLTDEQIIDLFKFGKEHGCIILANDLHRHWFAFYSIKYLTAIFSKSWLVRNDACLSVRRAFSKNELEYFLKQAGFTKFSVTWSWAFRFTVIGYS
tara:strand:- start:729 stop:1424 length:696 start_codon:yes stop_codon:yes gene_type:complete